MNTHRSFGAYWRYIAAIFVLGCFFVVLNATATHALGKLLPHPPDVEAAGQKGLIDLHFKKIKIDGQVIATVVENNMSAYYPKSTKKSGKNRSIKILPSENGKLCNIERNGKDKITGSLSIVIQAAGGKAKYLIPMQKVCEGSNFYNRTFAFPNTNLYDNDESGDYKANITISYGSNVPAGKTHNSNDFNYRMLLTGDDANKGKLGLRENDSAQKFGLRSAYSNAPYSTSNKTIRAAVPFGFPCSTDVKNLSDKKRTVKLYDADAVFGDTYMWVEKNGKKLSRGDYSPGNNMNDSNWDNASKRWKAQGSNKTFNSLILKKKAITTGANYRLNVFNDGKNFVIPPHNNTLSVAIPYDSIFSEVECDYDLVPSVDPPSAPQSQVSGAASIPAQGHIEPNGLDPDTHEWQLTSRVYSTLPSLSGAKNTSLPCVWKGGISGSCGTLALGSKKFGSTKFDTAMKSAPSPASGKYVCFMMSVKKPTASSPTTQWRHSPMKCVGKRLDSTGVLVAPGSYSYFLKLNNPGESYAFVKEANAPKKDKFKGKEHVRDTYDWQISEIKFNKLPPSGNIGKKTGPACPTLNAAYSNVLKGSCVSVKSGANLFPEGGDPANGAAEGEAYKEFQDSGRGPDPIGTWTCYVMRYRINPKPLETLRNDIKAFVSDWNDDNFSSKRPSRWGDGYGIKYTPLQYDANGNVVGGGQPYTVGKKVNYNVLYEPYRVALPPPEPPTYKYTSITQDSCSISGIDPKIQVRGHDVVVGGDISTYVRTMPSNAGPDAKNFGSFGEYSVMARGIVRLMGEPAAGPSMASGVGMLFGSSSPDQNEWSSLTFTNNNPDTFGKFDTVKQPALPDISNPTETHSGAYSIPGSTYSNSDDRVIVVDGTVTITGDLKYPDTYNSIGQIPRVIIVADNIEIAPGVTRIDPWLIARGTGGGDGIGADGILNTCNEYAQASNSVELKIGKCDKQLTFNGPVMAGKAYLYRTGGSRTTQPFNPDWDNSNDNPDRDIDPKDYCEEKDCKNGRAALNAPAEIFNLRPDTYLSAYSGNNPDKPVLITDKVTELPPRF